MKIHEALAQALAAEGCETIFSLMGDANLTMLAAFARIPGRQIIAARNEAGAVAMADGYFRASGRVGVATITCGPGLTQCGTSLVAASRNRSAMVVVTGETPPHWPITLQQLDQRRFIEACETRYHTLTTADHLASDIAAAFLAARETSGPVVLSAPLDMLDRELRTTWSYRPSAALTAPRGHVAASGAAVDMIVEQLAQASSPVIIAGRGAVLAGAREELRTLARRTGALTGTTLPARGLFSGDEFDIGVVGGFVATPAEELLRRADFVLAVGAELGHLTTESGTLFPNARIIRIDIEPLPWQAGIPPGLFVRGDARETVRLVNDRLIAAKVSKVGLRSAESRALLAQPVELPPRANDGVDPRRLMIRLSGLLPEGIVVSLGLGHFWSFPAMYLDVPRGGDMRICHQFGAIGQTLPVAIGQVVAEPDRPHLMIEGDASLMMNLQELETAARHRLPLKILVFNDGGLGAEVHKLNRRGQDASLAAFPTPGFVGIARAVGGDGVVVTVEDEIDAAYAAARRAAGLFVIDARISPTTISDPYLRTHFQTKAPVAIHQRSPGEPA